MFETVGSKVGPKKIIKSRAPTSQYVQIDDNGEVIWCFGLNEPPTEKFRFDASGTMLLQSSSLAMQSSIGYPIFDGTTVGGVASPNLESFGQSSGAGMGIFRFSPDASGAHFTLLKSRDATVGNNTIIQANDALGTLVFAGANGTSYDIAAAITGSIDTAPGASADMPGRLSFWLTPNASATPVERWRMSNDGIFSTNGGMTPFSPAGLAPKIQIHDTGIGASEEIWRWSNDASPVRFVFGKSLSATINTHAAALPGAGDQLAEIRFLVDDISTYRYNAAIRYTAEGTPATGSVPVNLNFCTGITGITEQWRLDSGGRWLGNQSYGTIGTMTVNTLDNKLQINGNTAATAGLSISMFSGSGGAGSAGGGGIGPHIDFYRSMSSSTGGATVLSTNGTGIGILNFYGAQQTGTLATQTLAAQIAVELDGGATSGTTVDMPSRMRFSTMSDGLGGTPGAVDPIEAFRIDSNQIKLFSVGGTGVTVSFPTGTGSTFPRMMVTGIDQQSAALGIVRFSADANSPCFTMAKSRDATIGTYSTAVSANDLLGEIVFGGSDTVALRRAGAIQVYVDGTASSGDMPGRFEFRTCTDGTTTLSLALTISNTQYLTGKAGGVYGEEQITVSSSDFAGGTGTAAQAFFTAAQDSFAADASTTYEFDALLVMSKTAGTTSHTISLGFGGTASFTNIDYLCEGTPAGITALTNTTGATQTVSFLKAATATVLTSAITTASINFVWKLRGVMRVNTAGTIIPQYTLSAGPGGAYSTLRDSYFRMWRVGTNTDTVKGGWS